MAAAGAVIMWGQRVAVTCVCMMPRLSVPLRLYRRLRSGYKAVTSVRFEWGCFRVSLLHVIRYQVVCKGNIKCQLPFWSSLNCS